MAMVLNQYVQAGASHHLNRIAPGVKVPGHLQLTRGRKSHGQSAVGLICQGLVRVIHEFVCNIGEGGGKASDDRPTFTVIVKASKGACGMAVHVKAWIPLKAVGLHIGLTNSVPPEMLHPPIAAHFARHQIAAGARDVARGGKPP